MTSAPTNEAWREAVTVALEHVAFQRRRGLTQDELFWAIGANPPPAERNQAGLLLAHAEAWLALSCA